MSLKCLKCLFCPAPLTALVIFRDVGLIAAVFWVRYKTVPPPVRHTSLLRTLRNTFQQNLNHRTAKHAVQDLPEAANDTAILSLSPQVTLSKFFNPCYTTAQLKPTLFSKVTHSNTNKHTLTAHLTLTFCTALLSSGDLTTIRPRIGGFVVI